MMSEEKRFDIVGKEFVGYTEGYAYIIRDNSIVCEPHRWRQWSVWEDKEDVEDLCDLLNELNEENDVLKQQLKTKYVVNKQYEELQRLKKENKQLRKTIALFEVEEDEINFLKEVVVVDE